MWGIPELTRDVGGCPQTDLGCGGSGRWCRALRGRGADLLQHGFPRLPQSGFLTGTGSQSLFYSLLNKVRDISCCYNKCCCVLLIYELGTWAVCDGGNKGEGNASAIKYEDSTVGRLCRSCGPPTEKWHTSVILYI